MNYSKTASYSLNILSYMANHQEMEIPAAYLNKKPHIIYSFLHQTLANITKQGFIQNINFPFDNQWLMRNLREFTRTNFFRILKETSLKNIAGKRI